MLTTTKILALEEIETLRLFEPPHQEIYIYRDEDWYIAECMEIPGCVSQGKTRDEALANIREAVALCMEVVRESLASGDSTTALTTTIDAVEMPVAHRNTTGYAAFTVVTCINELGYEVLLHLGGVRRLAFCTHQNDADFIAVALTDFQANYRANRS